jgi:tetratricopeptide (TPR) repeat protein
VDGRDKPGHDDQWGLPVSPRLRKYLIISLADFRGELVRISYFFAVSLLAVLCSNLPAAANSDERACRTAEPAARIAPCTRLLVAADKGGMSLTAIYSNRGWAYMEMREIDLAMADLNEAIRIEPKNHFAFNHRGWGHNEKKNFDAAIADLTESIRLNAKYAPAFNNRANAFRAKEELERALADYDEAIRLDPKYLRAYNNRAFLHLRFGDREKALADFRKVVESPAPLAGDRQRQEVARARIESLSRPAAPESSKRVALVIGNSDYANVGALNNPKNDAREIASALRRLGFNEVMELYDLDQGAMSRALRDFGDHAAGAEWAVVFFSGHGMEMNGTNYLVPIDAQLKRDAHVADEAISLDRVQAKVDAASRFGLVILDACRNNPFLKRMVRAGGTTRSVGQGLGVIEPEGNVLVAYAAKHGTFAEDGTEKHSPFTEALLRHIEEPGLEVSILFRRIRDDVRKKTERRQDPFVYGSLGSELLYFKTKPR